MKTSIIIHGHFYQPPRENPYTGIVPIQSTAKPNDSWNESIYRTCYKPNAQSRYLSQDGRIRRIYNNYINISSNIGPTLLEWLDTSHPAFIQRLLDADRQSIRRYGHSCFMAQGYNHTIMPLDCEHTKRIQTVWAIESYRTRFGHDPEGMWLAECAIDEETVDILAEYGIRFVVLAPWQAVAIDGKSTEGRPMPSDRPFIIKGKRGSLSAFFYDGEFASGVSFGHMLRDADSMFRHLCETRSRRGNPPLLHWATDGEIYGHHEPFGDMGLAALISKINESDEFEIDNYASYLERHPATEVATLGKGDDGKGTSWSCSHGVGRWERDCGCHTGGLDSWNQKWRGPLRKAFNNLETEARAIMEEKVSEVLGPDFSYKDLTLSYKAVVSHQMTVSQFVDTLRTPEGKPLDYSQRVRIATMLEAFRNIMFTYTSCGWFFNDLAGIEPRQNISYGVYAARLIDDLYGTGLCSSLLQDLEGAVSNVEAEGTGADIARHDMQKGSSAAYACAYFAANRNYAAPENYVDSWGFFKLLHIEGNRMAILNTRTLREYDMTFTKTPNARGPLAYTVTDNDSGVKLKDNMANASEKTLRTIASWTEARLSASLSGNFINTLAENIGNYMILISANRSLAKDTVFTENIGSCIKAIKSLVLDQPDMEMGLKVTRIRQLLYFVMIKGRPVDIQDITYAFSERLRMYARDITRQISDQNASHALMLLRVAREEGLNPDITNLQNAAYSYINKDNPRRYHIERQLMIDLLTDLNIEFDESDIS